MPPKKFAGLLHLRSVDLMTRQQRVEYLISIGVLKNAGKQCNTMIAPTQCGEPLHQPSNTGNHIPHTLSAARPSCRPQPSASSTSLALLVSPIAPTSSRSDVPIVKRARRGTQASALSVLAARGVDSLVADLERDRYAASGRGDTACRNATWSRFHVMIFGKSRPVLPSTVSQYKAVAALFKAQAYRSFPNYASSIKQAHVEAGHAWDDQLALTANWCRRSVERGMGPPRQSAPFNLSLVTKMDRTSTPFVSDGPQHPVTLLQLASIFLLREIEVAGACVSHWSFDHSAREVTWLLPASKTDHMALGVSRSWGCLCGIGSLPCPYHLAATHYKWVRDQCVSFSARADDFPLFPTVTGEVADKEAVVQSFEAIASALDEPLYTPDGVRRYGGHSARVTGAQSLAAHGVEVLKIRILARHSSDAIMRYVADAPLKALRQDLGLPVQDKLLQNNGTYRILRSRLTACERKLPEHEARISACERSLELLTSSSSPTLTTPPRYIQNLLSMAIHQTKPPGSVTVCGWDYSRQKALGNVITSECLEQFPWSVVCDRCLPKLRGELRSNTGDGGDPLAD